MNLVNKSSFFTSTIPIVDGNKLRMKKIFILVVVSFFFFSFVQAGEHSGNWHMVGKISEKCDFIGNAELVVNFRNIKIKVKKWRWNDSHKFKEKFFKGKIRKNNIDIFMQARALGYKHILKGAINNDKIFLTFSSTHTEMNERFGGCTFEFIKN